MMFIEAGSTSVPQSDALLLSPCKEKGPQNGSAMQRRAIYFQILTAPSRLPESSILVGSSVTLTSNTASSWLVRGATRPFSCIDGRRRRRRRRR